MRPENDAVTMTQASDNPLLQPWDTPYGLPPFDAIRPEHFAPAFEHAMRSHRAEVDAISGNSEAPTFENTLAALDRSGRALGRIAQLFFNLTASATSPALQAVERQMSPRLAAHHSAVHLDAGLFARIEELWQRRGELGLTGEQVRLAERVHLDFVRAGARLTGSARARYAAIEERLAELTTRFGQNVLADEASYRLILRDERDLAGLPADVRAAAREAAQERGESGVSMITLSRSLIVPFLTFSERRDLREQAFTAWTGRGEHDGEQTIGRLPARSWRCATSRRSCTATPTTPTTRSSDRMAGTPQAVARLLEQVWEPAKARAAAERDALQAMARSRGATHAIEPWDWRFYAEKVRNARIDFDDAVLKPYFSLDRMLVAAFDTARRLFGIRFVERPDLHAYHPDVRVFEVRGSDDAVDRRSSCTTTSRDRPSAAAPG